MAKRGRLVPFEDVGVEVLVPPAPDGL